MPHFSLFGDFILCTLPFEKCFFRQNSYCGQAASMIESCCFRLFEGRNFVSKIILRPFEPGDYGTFALFYRELHRLHAKAMPELFRP